MSGRLSRMCLLGVIVGLVGISALAEDRAATDPSEVSRLEALLNAQQQKIEALEQQVAAAGQADMDAARIEEMKKQIREVLSEQEFRESLMPTAVQAGYNKGFFIKSSDDKFLLRFNGLMQFRWTHYNTRSRNRYRLPGYRREVADRTGFDGARIRIKFGGHAYSKDLTYLIELDQSSPNAYDTRVLYAYADYRFIEEFHFRAGIFRLASTRANFGSTTHMQFADWPTMDAVFGLGIGTGVRLWGQLFQKRVEYFLDVVNSLNNPNTQTITTDEDRYANGHDNNPAILARVVWHALTGACLANQPADDASHFESYSDIERHSEPALDLGMHYAFNEDYQDGTMRIPFNRNSLFRAGGFGLTRSQGLQINQFGFDAAFKYMGFSLTGEYVVRIQDVRSGEHAPFTPLFQLTGDGSTAAQQGGYLQAGYFLPIPGLENKLEVVGRVGGVSILAGGQEGTWDYGGGLNYYIEGHKVKLQTDITKVSEVPISNPSHSLANVNDDALIFRVQLQVAF